MGWKRTAPSRASRIELDGIFLISTATSLFRVMIPHRVRPIPIWSGEQQSCLSTLDDEGQTRYGVVSSDARGSGSAVVHIRMVEDPCWDDAQN